MMMAMTRPLTRPSATLSPLRGARGNAGRVAQRGRGQQGPKFPLAPRQRGEGGQRPGEGRVIRSEGSSSTLSRDDGEGCACEDARRTAAERRHLRSPRRKPWGQEAKQTSRGAATYAAAPRLVSARFIFPALTRWAT